MPINLLPLITPARARFLLQITLSVLVNYYSIVYGATFYVATNGSDGGTGSSDSPWRTIQKGVDTIKPGDTLIVKAGTYNERVHVSKSGTVDQRLTVKGERGTNGEWLTIVDGSEILPPSWVPAPEVGSGVWKIKAPVWRYDTGFTLEPCSLTANGKSIWRINYALMDGGKSQYLTQETGFQMLARSASSTIVPPYAKDSVRFWDGLEALFGTKGGYLYVRFRNGDNPNTKNMRTAPWSYQCRSTGSVPETATFFLWDKSYVTISNLEIRGTAAPVSIRDSAANNIIENSYIHGGDIRVQLYTPAGSTKFPNKNAIRNNVMKSNLIGSGIYTFGAWEGGTGSSGAAYDALVASHLYEQNKYTIGDSTSRDAGIHVYNAVNSEIYFNLITDGAWAVLINEEQSGGTKVYTNTMRNFSGGAVYFGAGNPDTYIYDNRIQDVNIAFRGNYLDMNRSPAPTTAYIYKNQVWLPPKRGEFVFLSSQSPSKQNSPVEIYIYHNTFVGSANGFWFSYQPPFGLNKVLVINNIIQSSFQAYVWPGSDFCNDRSKLGGWDYNWVFGSTAYCAWDLGNNVSSGSKIWSDASLPDFTLPSNSNARKAGINVSTTFTIGTRSYPALPGYPLLSGIAGTKPDIGAGPGETIAPPSAPPPSAPPPSASPPSAPANLVVSQ